MQPIRMINFDERLILSSIILKENYLNKEDINSL